MDQRKQKMIKIKKGYVDIINTKRYLKEGSGGGKYKVDVHWPKVPGQNHSEVTTHEVPNVSWDTHSNHDIAPYIHTQLKKHPEIKAEKEKRGMHINPSRITNIRHIKEYLQEGGPTRKHFKMAAETIKAIKDPEERRRHAEIHATLYAKGNPRFSKEKFMTAADVKPKEFKESNIDRVLHTLETKKNWNQLYDVIDEPSIEEGKILDAMKTTAAERLRGDAGELKTLSGKLAGKAGHALVGALASSRKGLANATAGKLVKWIEKDIARRGERVFFKPKPKQILLPPPEVKKDFKGSLRKSKRIVTDPTVGKYSPHSGKWKAGRLVKWDVKDFNNRVYAESTLSALREMLTLAKPAPSNGNKESTDSMNTSKKLPLTLTKNKNKSTINEISKSLIKSYLAKAVPQKDMYTDLAQDAAWRERTGHGDKDSDYKKKQRALSDKFHRKSQNRFGGMLAAHRRLMEEEKKDKSPFLGKKAWNKKMDKLTKGKHKMRDYKGKTLSSEKTEKEKENRVTGG